MALTPEEERILNSQQDPDANEKVHYPLTEELQKVILGTLLNDTNFLIQSEGLVFPEYFEVDAHQMICRILFRYFDQYKVKPSRTYVEQELEDHIKEKPAEVKLFFRGELNSVYDNYVSALEDRDYLRDKITDFAKEQALKKSFLKALDEFGKKSPNKWNNIYKILQEGMSVERNFDLGLEYFESFEERYTRVLEAREKGDIFTSGFTSIDNGISGGGTVRGEIASWMGLSGTGKSLCLTTLARCNINRGKRVLYVTLELDEDRTAERFDAQFTNVDINSLYANKDKVFEALKDYSEEFDDTRRLIIKHFPSGSMDIPTLRAYLTQLHMRNFIPDVVIVDYVGEMRDYPNMPTWESRQKIVRDFRGLADEENFFGCLAMQPDKKAKEAVRLGGVLTDENLADSYGQIRPLDCFWTISQTTSEKTANILRIYIAKHRFGRSNYMIYAQIDPRTLIISEITKDEYEKRRKNADNKQELAAQERAADVLVRENK